LDVPLGAFRIARVHANITELRWPCRWGHGRFRAVLPGEIVAEPSVSEKRRTFRELHRSGCFVIPNPWNAGSARYLEGLGFKALATTSSGYAHAQGFPDGAMTRDNVLQHYRALVGATALPVNADFENGFAHDADGVAASVALCVGTGVAGLSIEDFTGDEKTAIYALDTAVARVKAARATIDRNGGEVVFTARCENFLHGNPSLDDTIHRLKAYSEAGADCLYAPGIKTREQIEAVVKAMAPKPVNFLNSGPFGFTVADIAGMGVRRISVGGALARVAMNAFIKSAREIAEHGKFDSFAGITPNAELNAFFSRYRPAP